RGERWLRQSAKSTEGKKGSVTLNDVRFTPKADVRRRDGMSARGHKMTFARLLQVGEVPWPNADFEPIPPAYIIFSTVLESLLQPPNSVLGPDDGHTAVFNRVRTNHPGGRNCVADLVTNRTWQAAGRYHVRA